MADASVSRVVVTIDDQHLPAVHSVADALRAAGMQVTGVLPTSGIITGEVPQANMHTLASVPGVISVEPDGEMRAV